MEQYELRAEDQLGDRMKYSALLQLCPEALQQELSHHLKAYSTYPKLRQRIIEIISILFPRKICTLQFCSPHFTPIRFALGEFRPHLFPPSHRAHLFCPQPVLPSTCFAPTCFLSDPLCPEAFTSQALSAPTRSGTKGPMQGLTHSVQL